MPPGETRERMAEETAAMPDLNTLAASPRV